MTATILATPWAVRNGIVIVPRQVRQDPSRNLYSVSGIPTDMYLNN